jgi:endonuclease YncB( thermonuclease family)
LIMAQRVVAPILMVLATAGKTLQRIRRPVASACLIGGLFFLWSESPTIAQTLSGSVLSIGDGDTIRIKDGSHVKTIRLACIDTPETSQSPYGAAARKDLVSLLPVGSPVVVKVKTTDRYGRSVGEITLNGRNVNQALVSSGAAFVYWQYIQGCDRQTYSRLENEARLKAKGVWSVKNGITRPWDYRAGRRSPAATTSNTPNSNQSKKYRCLDFKTYAQAQEALKQGHDYLDKDGDGSACESLR